MSSLTRVADTLGRQSSLLLVAALGATIATFALRTVGAGSVVVFVVAAVALAALAGLVGAGTHQLGHRLGAGATGVLQSAFGNLPELFISLFALRAGLVVLVQTALVGSILANSLLVLGLAFVAGGLRNGVQRFGTEPVRMIATLLVLAVAALTIPTLATAPGAPDVGHARDLSIVCALVLLVVFGCSVPFSIRGGPGASAMATPEGPLWPVPMAVGMLAGAAIAAAFASDWFVEALRPAMADLGLSEAFVGLVIVAIAGNAVENLAGVQAARRNQPDLAISLILNSSLQVAIAMTPALVLASLVIGGPALTLVLSPLLIAALVLAAILDTVIVVDGESTWLEGIALIGLYVIVAASVWWGPRIAV
jgi:Ca2+:H+ antiporter